MQTPAFQVPKLNSHYDLVYDADELAWYRLGAKGKAKNIKALLADRQSEVSSVLDVGCGSGAVLLALRGHGIGQSLSGIDVTVPADRIDPDIVGSDIEIARYDGHRLPFADDSFDLVYSSHVLEHVADERGFIAELARVARTYVFVEVPCELHARTSIAKLQTTLNIGHINAYTPESFALTLATSGLVIDAIDLFDVDREIHHWNRSAIAGEFVTLVRRSALKLGHQIASRLFTYHCAALCRVAATA